MRVRISPEAGGCLLRAVRRTDPSSRGSHKECVWSGATVTTYSDSEHADRGRSEEHKHWVGQGDRHFGHAIVQCTPTLISIQDLFQPNSWQTPVAAFWFRILLCFRWMGGSACKVDDVTALPSHIQDGGYALLWQRYDNNKMAAICYSTSSTLQS